MVALITLICLTFLYVIDINFPLHRYNLWRRFLRKTRVAPPVYSIRNYSIAPGSLHIPDGPKWTPDLSVHKIAIVSDNSSRIDNFISNVLKGDPYDFKYLKVSCIGKVDQLKGLQIKKVHLIYGWDRLPGTEVIIDDLMKRGVTEFYGDQLYMEI